MKLNFDYGTARLRDLRFEKDPNNPGSHVVEIAGNTAEPTGRLWSSLSRRYGISQNMFRYFSHAEVFGRVAESVPNGQFRYCLVGGVGRKRQLLAISDPERSIIERDELVDVVREHGGEGIKYANGVITSTHRQDIGNASLQIGCDEFERRFTFEAPVDGFGAPRIYTSLLRLLCTNGMIGYSRAFRSDISVGNDWRHAITRALASFDHDEGYTALQQRIASAQTSWASVRECLQLQRCLEGVELKKSVHRSGLIRDFRQTIGDLNELYGLANLDAVNTKRQRVLPAQSRVYDLLNFASEVATHHSRPFGTQVMQAYIGSLISDEYDMEGTAETETDFADFFVQGSEVGPPASLN